MIGDSLGYNVRTVAASVSSERRTRYNGSRKDYYCVTQYKGLGIAGKLGELRPLLRANFNSRRCYYYKNKGQLKKPKPELQLLELV